MLHRDFSSFTGICTCIPDNSPWISHRNYREKLTLMENLPGTKPPPPEAFLKTFLHQQIFQVFSHEKNSSQMLACYRVLQWVASQNYNELAKDLFTIFTTVQTGASNMRVKKATSIKVQTPTTNNTKPTFQWKTLDQLTFPCHSCRWRSQRTVWYPAGRPRCTASSHS